MSSRNLDSVKSNWTKVILSSLVDGDVVLADIKSMSSRSVPPGRAIRMWRKFNRKPDVKAPTDQDKIRVGSRAIVNGSIHSLKQKGMVEIYHSDGVSFLTLTEKGRKRYDNQED